MAPVQAELWQSISARIDQGDPPAEVIARLGDPEPAKAADALLRAGRHPDLVAGRPAWLPELLATARPGAAAQSLVELAERTRASTGRPLDPAVLPALSLVLGSSPFLARHLLRHPDWTVDLRGCPPAAPSTAPVDPRWDAIRAAKYRGLLRVAARDLAGRPFEESLRELSDLADGCLRAALRCAEREMGAEAPALLGLGKLGGRELNFSSDVDLMFVYEATSDAEDLAQNQRASELIGCLKRNLEARTEDGFAYRVDLDLRPEGRAGVLANSIDAALTYYETFGAEWERQMLIRLRPIAGPRAALDTFVREVTPFVYRSLIDPRAIGAAREMKARIEAQRRESGVDLEVDLKEGPGGIRDVEFLVQALQLFHGGRRRELRTGNVLEGLRALERTGILAADVVEALGVAYLWLRRAEHALQLPEERQTHRFPREPAAQVELARRMGYGDGEGRRARDRLLDDWTNVRAEVRLQFDALVLREDDAAGEAP